MTAARAAKLAPVRYVLAGQATSESLQAFAEAMAASLDRRGWERGDDVADADLVLNLVDPADPKPFRRRSRGTFVAALHELPEPSPTTCCRRATRCSSARSRTSSSATCRGRGRLVHDDGARPLRRRARRRRRLAEAVVERLLPLATSRLVIDNEFRTDLEPELWDGDELTEEIKRGRRARSATSTSCRRRSRSRSCSTSATSGTSSGSTAIGGLSYGNLSARKDETRFWMSASGVDKSKLETPGRDILLVSGYDPERRADDPQRAARTSSRAASRSTRSSTG